MKYSAAPAGDGVGPPVWDSAALQSIREPKNRTRIDVRILWIIAIFPILDRSWCGLFLKKSSRSANPGG
jgi:hypothetical protein